MDAILVYGILGLWLSASLYLAAEVYGLQKQIAEIEAVHASEKEILEAEIEEMKNDHESELERVKEETYEDACRDGFYQGRGWKEYGEP